MLLIHCHYCQKDKPENEYHPKNKARCRSCKSEYDSQWKKNNPERAKDHGKRTRALHRDYRRAYYQAWYDKNKRKRTTEKDYKNIDTWVKANPEAKKSHKLVRQAVYDGKLIRPWSCSNCSSKRRIQGHHKDYSLPLDVVWLCVSCHRRVHHGSLQV